MQATLFGICTVTLCHAALPIELQPVFHLSFRSDHISLLLIVFAERDRQGSVTGSSLSTWPLAAALD